MKFWNRKAMSPFTSRSIGASRGSRDITGGRNNSNGYFKPSPLDPTKVGLQWNTCETEIKDKINHSPVLKFVITTNALKEENLTNNEDSFINEINKITLEHDNDKKLIKDKLYIESSESNESQELNELNDKNNLNEKTLNLETNIIL